MKRAVVCLVGLGFAALAVRADGPLRFEAAPRLALATPRVHDPRFVLRASRALTMIAIQQLDERGQLIVATSIDDGDNFYPPIAISGPNVSAVGSGESGPSLALGGVGLCALWEQTRPGGGSELVISSSPTGAAWSAPQRLTDRPGSPSGFGALAASGEQVCAAWLDGRAGVAGVRDLYVAYSTDGGKTFGKNSKVAARVCPACRPTVAITDDGGVYIAWRGIADDGTRDIYVARSIDAGKTFGPSSLVARDGWKISDCPRSAPTLVAAGNSVHLAWYSEGHGGRDTGVRWTTSTDGGKSFAPPMIVSRGVLDPNHPELSVSPTGRVHLAFQGRPDTGDGWSPFKAYVLEVTTWVAATQGPTAAPGVYDKVSYPTAHFDATGRLWIFWTAGESVLLSRARENTRP